MKISIAQPAAIALRTLGDDDRRRVTAWFDHLQNWENDDFVRSNSRPLATDDNVFVLRTSSDFRIFFSFQNAGIEVLDIARQKETLQGFAQVVEPGRC